MKNPRGLPCNDPKSRLKVVASSEHAYAAEAAKEVCFTVMAVMAAVAYGSAVRLLRRIWITDGDRGRVAARRLPPGWAGRTEGQPQLRDDEVGGQMICSHDSHCIF